MSITLAPMAAADEATSIALSTEPNSISVSRLNDLPAVEIAVVARSTTAKKVPGGSTIYAISPPGFVVHIGTGRLTGADVVWIATISAAPTAPDSGTIEFALAAESGAPIRAKLDVKVNPGQGASPADDLELSVKTSTEGISDQVPGSALLVMRNKSTEPLRIDNVQFSGPANLVSDPKQLSLLLEPHELRVTPFTISFANNRQPMGSYPVIVSARAMRSRDSWNTSGTVTAEFTATSEVPGVNEALKLLELPSILLIPGALILSVWSSLYGGTTQPAWLTWKSSTFWVAAITLSIMVFGTLGFAKRALGWNINFLAGYNITDIAYLWLGCVLFAATLWGARRACLRIGLAIIRSLYGPLASDTPIEFLKKLKRSHFPYYLPAFAETSGSSSKVFQTLFSAPADLAWFIPGMLVTRSGADSASAQMLIDAINETNDKPHEFKKLIEQLSKGIASGAITLKWSPSNLGGPALQRARPVGDDSLPRSPIAFS